MDCVVEPHRDEWRDMRSSVCPDSFDPEQLGPLESGASLFPAGRDCVLVAESCVELGYRLLRQLSFSIRDGRPATLDPNKRQRDGDEARERSRRQPERRREHVVPPASLPTAAEHRDHAAVVHSHGFVLRPATPIPTTPSL